ncbi:MAG: hypothetical protein M3377_09325 [Actinomycetota bacterium]|nr:hypothetical protein [Actinomycetota bacterium]
MRHTRVFRETLAWYLSLRDRRAVTSTLDEIVDELGSEPDPWVTEAARCAEIRKLVGESSSARRLT